MTEPRYVGPLLGWSVFVRCTICRKACHTFSHNKVVSVICCGYLTERVLP